MKKKHVLLYQRYVFAFSSQKRYIHDQTLHVLFPEKWFSLFQSQLNQLSIVVNCTLISNAKESIKKYNFDIQCTLIIPGEAFEPGCFIVIGEEVPKWNNPA